MTDFFITAAIALLLDFYLKSHWQFKPFDWFRVWVDSIEQRFNGGTRSQGIGAVLVATLPIIIGVLIVRFVLHAILPFLAFLFDIAVVYFCLGFNRLYTRSTAVYESLEAGNMIEANERLRRLARRGAASETESSIAHTTVEALLKQGNNRVIATLFWFGILGPLGAVLQRLVRILDTKWGHQDARFIEFGWLAARLDDVIGWVPARLTAIGYAIMGSFEDAMHCWRKQVGIWKNINSGPLLSSGLGAMHMQDCDTGDGGESCEIVETNAGHVRRATALVLRVLIFWMMVALLMAVAEVMGVLGS
jgi:adenosylcobinamide-phosphate synthase